MISVISMENTYPEDGPEEDPGDQACNPEEDSLVLPLVGIPAADLRAACSGGSQAGAGEPSKTPVEPRSRAEP